VKEDAMFERADVTTHRATLHAAAERHRLVSAAATGPTPASAALKRTGLMTRARTGVGFSIVGLGLRVAAPAVRRGVDATPLSLP
jgi:hypothetical protein